MTRVRLEAARVLASVDQGHTTLAAEVERARGGLTTARDRGLLLELVSGTLRWRNQLDALIAAAAARPLADLDVQALMVLRLGAYQLLHLERIPPHAIVHESVDVVRALGARRAAGFVNAVLRTLSTTRPEDVLPARPAADASRRAMLDYLTIAVSHPRWLAARWLDRVGFERAERWCRFNNAPPAPTVRRIDGDEAALVRALEAAGIAGTPAAYVAGAVRLPAGALGQLPADVREHLVIQDEGSQLVALAAGVRPGDRVLDTCAAPGGKTVLLVGAAGPSGQVVAADRRRNRIGLLRRTLARHAIEAPVLCLDVTRPLPFGPVFDVVLLDAPCSGLGTLSRDPDLKWRRTAADIETYARAQTGMIERAAEAVRPGGRLVYATCSSEPEENIAVVDAFLRARDAFALEPVSLPEPVSATAMPIDGRGCLSTAPDRHGLDAYFAAVLVRRRTA